MSTQTATAPTALPRAGAHQVTFRRPGALEAEQLQQVARGEARVADEPPDREPTRNESGAEEQSAEEEAPDAEPRLGDAVASGIRMDGVGAGEDDEAHDTNGQDDALEDPRAQVAHSYALYDGA